MIVTEPRERLKDFAEELLGIGFGSDAFFIGNVLNGELRAVTVYCNFQGKSCQTHICGKGSNWMTKKYLWAIFDYPFKKQGLKVILGVISGANKKSLKLSRHLGFKEIAIIEDAHKDGDLVIMTMKSSECRWLTLGARYGCSI